MSAATLSWDSVVRAQQSAGDPKLRYCANLGHKQDDESGLIYMRARYYDPNMGRFISQDVSRQGINQYVYCGGDPVNRQDFTGKKWDWWSILGAAAALIDLIGVGLAIAVGAPAAVIIGLIVLAAILIVVTTIHTFNDTISRGRGVLERGDNGSKAWERELKSMNSLEMIQAFPGVLDDMKSNGSFGEKILAKYIEIVFYLACAEAGE